MKHEDLWFRRVLYRSFLFIFMGLVAYIFYKAAALIFEYSA